MHFGVSKIDASSKPREKANMYGKRPFAIDLAACSAFHHPNLRRRGHTFPFLSSVPATKVVPVHISTNSLDGY